MLFPWSCSPRLIHLGFLAPWSLCPMDETSPLQVLPLMQWSTDKGPHWFFVRERCSIQWTKVPCNSNRVWSCCSRLARDSLYALNFILISHEKWVQKCFLCNNLVCIVQCDSVHVASLYYMMFIISIISIYGIPSLFRWLYSDQRHCFWPYSLGCSDFYFFSHFEV